MDAIMFLAKARLMCESHKSCNDCPLNDYDCCNFSHILQPEGMVAIVEKWGKPKETLVEKIRYSEKWQNTKCPEWVYKLIEAEENKR